MLFTQLSCVNPSTAGSIFVPGGIINCPKNKARLQEAPVKNWFNNLTMRYITLTYNFLMKNKKPFWVCDVKCRNTQVKEYLNFQSWFEFPLGWLHVKEDIFINWNKYPCKIELLLFTVLWLSGSIAAKYKQVPSLLSAQLFPLPNAYPIL